MTVVVERLDQVFADMRRHQGRDDRLRQADDHDTPVRPGCSPEEHCHAEGQLTIVISGTVRFAIGSEPVALHAGQLALFPGDVPHSTSVRDEEVVTLNVWHRRHGQHDPPGYSKMSLRPPTSRATGSATDPRRLPANCFGAVDDLIGPTLCPASRQAASMATSPTSTAAAPSSESKNR